MAYSKLIGGMVVLGIITLLIFSGPAQAFAISLDINNPDVEKGGAVNLDVNIETGGDDAPGDINFLEFKLIGPGNVDCKFSPNGEIISGCEGIKVIKSPSSDTGYCKDYGYGYGCKLKFRISIETEFFDIGTYATSLVLNAKGKETVIYGKDILINPKIKLCSIRANNGKIIVNGLDSDKNKINFFIPLKNAIKGEGYLTGQLGRERFIFRFKMDKILEFTKDITKVQVSGKYRIGTSGEYIDETAILTFDRIENKTSLTGNKVNMAGMDIYFRKGC